MHDGAEVGFADLFSGIGGFRLGLERAGPKNFASHTERERGFHNTASFGRWWSDEEKTDGCFRCIWSCDNDKYANQVYTARFGTENHFADDVRKVQPESIPDFDLLCAGFPCQSFSVAGKREGFKDTRGTLFFEILRIAEAKKPILLLLENVKGLLSHDEGLTFQIILESLDELGYWAEWQVLNSKSFGVPQNRERVFLVGHLGGEGGREVFPVTETDQIPDEDRSISSGETDIRNEPKIVNVPHGWNKGFLKRLPNLRADGDSAHNELLIYRHPINYSKKSVYTEQEEYPALRTVQRNPQAKSVIRYRAHAPNSPDKRWGKHRIETDICPTIATDLALEQGMRIRRLTPVECERLQGFPDGWTRGLSDTARYRCLGNAVTVPVITFLGKRILERCFS